MKQPKYVVDLSEEEQAQLESIMHKAKSSARQQTRARILLKANESVSNQEIMTVLEVSEDIVYRARQRFVEEGWKSALQDRGHVRAGNRSSRTSNALI